MSEEDESEDEQTDDEAEVEKTEKSELRADSHCADVEETESK